MIDRERLRTQLAKHEGCRPFVYDDATGKPIAEGTFVRGLPTVGIGRNLAGKGLSEDEIRYLLDNDITDCIIQAQTFRWFGALDPVRAAVIVELCFNLGLTRLRTFKKFLAAIAEQRFPVAAEELRLSKWYGQVQGRADTLINMIREGTYPP